MTAKYSTNDPTETRGMAILTTPKATLADLAKTSEKAELIAGRIVYFMATGFRPHRVALRITQSLEVFSRSLGRGFAFADNIGFAVPELASGRESFSPDASFFIGSPPEDEMDFIEGPPLFAVEVRSKTDYGPGEEIAMAAKRADYFEAGTQIVWDVDPVANIIRSFHHRSPDQPTVFQSGDIAHAEPALPGWSLDVAQLFQP